LILTNRYVDLVGEGVDIAIRAGELQDSSLMAKKVTITSRALFASPGYIAGAGVPKQPKDLSGHQCILFSKEKSDEWALINGKQRAKVKVSGSVTADDIAALKELALQDLGISLIPTFICRDDVAAKRLVPVLPGWASESAPICVVYPGQKFQHPKVRVLVDELAKMLTDAYATADKICGAERKS
jgi:DNA-binding transcriptional LysR family regulator